MANNFNTYSRRRILRVGSGLLIGAAAASLLPVLSLASEGRPKTILRFQFSTEEGGKGSFYLDTTTSAEPIFIGPNFREVTYLNSVSNLSFSSPRLNLEKQTAAWKVFPDITIPGNQGVLSGVSYPNGCTPGTSSNCLITIAVLYSGQYPELSKDPNSYLKVIGVDFFDITTGQLIKRDITTSSKVQALPEVVENK